MEQKTKELLKKQFQLHDSDTGSSEVQVALLTRRIEDLTQHLKSHRKDRSSRYGLIKMVSARRKLLNYLKGKDEKRYLDIVGRLKLRH